MCNILTSICQKQRKISEIKTRWNGSEIALIPKQTQVIQQGNKVRHFNRIFIPDTVPNNMFVKFPYKSL